MLPLSFLIQQGRQPNNQPYLKTDRAVVFGSRLSTGMVVEHGVRQAEAALGAVEEVVTPTHSAKTTPIAVELALVGVIVESTLLTEVVAEL